MTGEGPSPVDRRIWRVVAWVASIVVVLASIGIALLGYLWRAEKLDGAVAMLFTAEGIWVVLVGVVIAVVAWRAARGAVAAPMEVRYGDWGLLIVWVVAFVLALVFFKVSLLLSFLIVLIFALPAVALALFLIRLARRPAAPTFRQFWGALWAGTLSAVPALLLEAIGALLALLIVAAVALAFPQGQAYLHQVMRVIQALRKGAMWLSGPPEWILRVLASFFTLLYVALLIAVISPLVEEVFKSWWLAWAGRWLPPEPLTFFLVGSISGVAFAVFESLSGSETLAAERLSWGVGVLARLLPTLMHAAASGLGGMGWGYIHLGRRKQGIGLLLGGIGLHMLWNGALVCTLWGGLRLVVAVMSTPVQTGYLLPGLVFLIVGAVSLTLAFVAVPTVLLAVPLLRRKR